MIRRKSEAVWNREHGQRAFCYQRRSLPVEFENPRHIAVRHLNRRFAVTPLLGILVNEAARLMGNVREIARAGVHRRSNSKFRHRKDRTETRVTTNDDGVRDSVL